MPAAGAPAVPCTGSSNHTASGSRDSGDGAAAGTSNGQESSGQVCAAAQVQRGQEAACGTDGGDKDEGGDRAVGAEDSVDEYHDPESGSGGEDVSHGEEGEEEDEEDDEDDEEEFEMASDADFGAWDVQMLESGEDAADGGAGGAGEGGADEAEEAEEDEEDDDDEEEEEEEEEEDQGGPSRAALNFLLGIRDVAGRPTSHDSMLARFPRLPLPPQPLQHELAWQLQCSTNAGSKRRCCSLEPDFFPLADASDASTTTAAAATPSTSPPASVGTGRPSTDGAEGRAGGSSGGRRAGNAGGEAWARSSGGGRPAGAEEGEEDGARGSSGGRTRWTWLESLRPTNSRREAAAAAAAAAAGAGAAGTTGAARAGANGADAAQAGHKADGPPAQPLSHTLRLLLKRDLALGYSPGFSREQQRHLCIGRPSSLPLHAQRRVDCMDARAYIGQYSADGTFFVAAFQDQRVRLYDVENGWRLRKDVRARMCRWTVTDTSLSPDQRFLIYSSITDVAHLVAVGSQYDSVVESISNVTEVHEALHFSPQNEGQRMGREFGIWSIKWSGDGREIIAGTNDERVYIYDVESSRVVGFVDGHDDDVNAVAYMDSTPNLFASGSDDSFVKIWDRRLVGAERARRRPVGVLVGHTEGLTHLDSKGDGRYLISNSKDQCIKLWDLRSCMVSEGKARDLCNGRSVVPRFRWDYRWMRYPGFGFAVRHPHDQSIATFRGHEVRQTLIRAYFSPAHTTAQRYVYRWDIVTGEMVQVMRHHAALVRDCSWHPYMPNLTTVSWDGSVVEWGPQQPKSSLANPSSDPMLDWY